MKVMSEVFQIKKNSNLYQIIVIDIFSILKANSTKYHLFMFFVYFNGSLGAQALYYSLCFLLRTSTQRLKKRTVPAL